MEEDAVVDRGVEEAADVRGEGDRVSDPRDVVAV